MLKNGIEVRKRNSINYIYRDNRPLAKKPWLGGMFSRLYDSIMKNSIFPKKFEASLDVHNRFLERELGNVHDKRILELATGSGNLSDFLPDDNDYIGTDISGGLLKVADGKFRRRKFDRFELFASPAEDIPVRDGYADICICNLSLNFFGDLEQVIMEIRRTVKSGGVFICTVPVPERNKRKSIIRGTLRSESDIQEMFENAGFEFSPYDIINGALLYFRAIRTQK